MNAPDDPVTQISILGCDYNIKTPLEQQPALRLAAQMLQTLLATKKAHSPGLIGDKLLVLSALQLCAEHLELQQRHDVLQQAEVAANVRVQALLSKFNPSE
jgi:cell division protein ZapA